MGFKRPLVRIQSLGPRRSKLCIACSDFFLKSERAHAAAPPFQLRPAARPLATLPLGGGALRMRRAPCGYCAGLAVGRPPCGRHFSPLKCRLYPSLPKRLEIARFQAFFELSRQKWHSEAFQKRTRKRTDFKNRCAFFYQRARKGKWLSFRFRRRCAGNFH